MKAGDEVVCVLPNGGFKSPAHRMYWRRKGVTYPEVGKTYVIRDTFGLSSYPDTFALLQEIANPNVPYGRPVQMREAAFKLSAFRPVIKDKKILQWTTGADPSSDVWDNRRRKVYHDRAKDGARKRFVHRRRDKTRDPAVSRVQGRVSKVQSRMP